MNNLSFKRGPRPTGLFSVGHPNADTEIKLDKKLVGMIYAPDWQTKDGKWSAHFMVFKSKPDEDKRENCPWKWVQLSKRFDSEEEAREYVKLRLNLILKLNLRKED